MFKIFFHTSSAAQLILRISTSITKYRKKLISSMEVINLTKKDVLQKYFLVFFICYAFIEPTISLIVPSTLYSLNSTLEEHLFPFDYKKWGLVTP